ncbi:MAG: hypothetical protein ACQEVA_09520 [Myxococcota bacterium]
MSSNIGQLWRWGALALLTGGLAATGLTGCNSHPVEYTSAGGNIGVSVDFSPQTAESVDILWVIDSSGSMCQEQKALADNFDAFIDDFGKQNIDFHMGVTTTHQTPEGSGWSFPYEYGELQNRPRPTPSSVPGCSSPEAVTTALVRAAACTTDPESQKTSLTSGEAACLTDKNSAACESYCTSNSAESWCEEDENDPGTFEFNRVAFYRAIFPAENEYRDIPKVLRRDDYRQGNTVDIEALKADFACVSFVGVVGWGMEKGLGAAREAVSPEKVGTYYDPDQDPPENAPNYGLIRQDSQFALVMVTDENDCTYDNQRTDSINPELTIEELDARQCFQDICEFANSTQYDEEESPLIPPRTIAEQMASSIREIKQQEVDINDLIVASIHGVPERYEGQAFTKEECAEPGYEDIEPPCNNPNTFGTAFSGDRYQRFVEEFPEDQRFPAPGDFEGKMCQPDEIEGTLNKISEIIRAKTQVCIDEPVYRCVEDADCPDYPVTGGASECVPFASTGDNYCESAIQLIMTLDETEPTEASQEQLADPAQALEDSGYCKQGSIDTPDLPGACIVDSSKYELTNCPANDNGLTVSWTSPTYFSEIGEFNVEINYAVTPGGTADNTMQQ